MDSETHTTAEAPSWASARKISGWLAVLSFVIALVTYLLTLADIFRASGIYAISMDIFLITFGTYAILVSKGAYKLKTSGTQLQVKRARIMSILCTVMGIVFLGLGLMLFITHFLMIGFYLLLHSY